MSYYGPKDLKSQLLEFAARKLISKAIDAAAKHGGAKISKEVEARKFKQGGASRPLSSLTTNNSNSASNQRKNHPMSFKETAFQAPAPANRNSATGRVTQINRDPVELWVNTVIVTKDGAEPIRILSGRPLRQFNADKAVTTSNEEFNRQNAISNAFVNKLNKDAEALGLGEGKFYSPTGVMADANDPKTVILAAGIYLQLFREASDPAADAAAKIDIEADAANLLTSLFS